MATYTAGSLTSYFRVHEYRSSTVLLSVTLVVFSQMIIAVSGNAVHLTMVTPTPYGAGMSQVNFSCFRSSPDTNVDLSFGRPFMIGIPGSSIQTDTTLPVGAFASTTSTTPSAVTQYLPIVSVDSTGLFYCEGSSSGMTTRVYSIIHSNTRRFEPVDGLVTKTVNRGEGVTLSVSSFNGLGTAPLWRQIRNGIVDDLNSVSGQNTYTITLPYWDVMDGDLYAAVPQSTADASNNPFGMIRLIVRGCSADQWGPPDCTGVCNQCYNGGVCDDVTGQCICAPGFSGPNCLTACGMHRFGWDCELQCGSGNLVYNCTGSQFGLPDPYGSSCISGYSGGDCNTACSDGSFGAGCTQTCHCQSGTCDIYTGVCSLGCAAGWAGVNCQVSCGSNQCHNGATCQPQDTSYTCICQAGYIGMYCDAWDNEIPMISCPPNVTRYISSSIQQVSVTLPLPTATDISGIIAIISNPVYSSGSGMFGSGAHSITYTATDGAGNQASCSFTITVIFPCESNQCSNGATCQVQQPTYICLCQNGFSGMYCQITNLSPSAGSPTIIVLVCVVVFVVILVMGCLVYFLRVRKRRQQQSKPHESTRDQEMTGYENEITPDDDINNQSVGQNQASAYEPVGDVRSSTTYEDVGLPTWAKPWNVLWVDMMVGSKVLGKGQFGEVRYGGVMIEGEFCKAAIKKLREHASLADRKNFLDEFRSMTKIRRHPNIVTILGACQHEGELYVAMEYLPNGDLRSYLRNARSMDGEESLSSDKLLQFALDVAKGMQHLATSGVIHRDLAARNILLDENVVAKISDFGLSRGEDIYVQLSKTRVPTRWLSLESLTNQTYTTKSDVWSYGILLWEIATVGGTPYSGIKTGVLTSKLQTGYRMPKPTNCDIKIYDLMLKCWQEKPSERPSFKKIVSVLTTMAENQDDQIYMSLLPRSEEHKYVNIRPEFDDN